MNSLTLRYQRYTDRSWRPTTGQLSILLTVWFQRARQRRQLGQLNGRELLDIGVSPGAAQAEAAKPFWQS